MTVLQCFVKKQNIVMAENWRRGFYLNDFAPTVEREKFEETVKSLFQTKWLVELVSSGHG